MATPRNPLESFIWGSGGRAMTPEQVAREREIAAALTDQGADFSPVGHWLQGAARLGHSAAGAFRDWRASEGERAGREGFSDRWSSVFGGGSSSPVAEALASSVSPTALDAANTAGQAAPTTSSFSGGQQEFIDTLLPAALEVSASTGIDPRIIIAQAAQETGWGRSAPGNNFFGIKSHGQGGGQTLNTHEYIDGQRVNVSDSFRTFNSPEDSVRGYGEFIRANPRYGDFMAAQGLDAQLEALQASGYATDPNYSASVGSIARGIALPQQTQQVAGLDNTGISIPGVTDAPVTAAPQPSPGLVSQSGLPQSAAPGTVAQAGGFNPSIAELLALTGDPYFGYASPAQQQIVQALMGQQLQQQDPAYQQGLAQGALDLERGQWEFDQLRNAPPPLPDAPKVQEFYDENGQPYMAQWTGQGWERVGGSQRPNPTPLQLEYDSYVAQEIEAGREPVSQYEFDLARRGQGGVNVTTNVGDPEFGPTPAGYQLVRTPEGARLERIPGGPQEEEKIRDAEIAAETAERALGNIQSIVEDPNLGLAVGLGGFLPAIPNTPQAGLVTRINQLQGTAFLQAFETLRGGGQISNVEGQKAQEAIARLNRVQSQEDFINALNDLGEVVHTGLNRARREAGMEGLGDFVPFKASSGDSGQTGQSVADPSIFPAPGTMEDGYRFLGGDPADPNSWERVQ